MPDNIDINGLSGNDNQGLPGDVATPDTNVKGVSDDIDAIFGTSTPDNSGSGDDPFGGQPSSGKGDAQLDYSNMNHEQLAKLFQSRYDKAQAELQKAQPKLQKADALEQFYNELYENQDVRRAFIAELEPDLVKPKDPYGVLEEQLKKEFGEDYVPDDEESKRPFTPSWKYYKRLSELENKIKESSNKVPKTLKELRAERERVLQEQQAKDNEIKTNVLQTMKWSDRDYQSFASWVTKLNATDLAKIYHYAQTKRANIQGAPNLAALSGGNVQTPNEVEAELKRFFG